MESNMIRVLLTKMGLDAHDRGIKFIASLLRDAGMEVIYLGRYGTPETVAKVAVEENVDVIGLSFLSGEYDYYIPPLMDLLTKEGLNDVVVMMGGLILDEDTPWLQQRGVKGIFNTADRGDEIIKFIRGAVRKKEGKESIA